MNVDKDNRKERYRNMYEAILVLETIEECEKFLDDFCSINELNSMEQRLRIALLLEEGRNFKEIAKMTHSSTTTISRVKQTLAYGAGGYRIVFNKLRKEKVKN